MKQIKPCKHCGEPIIFACNNRGNTIVFDPDPTDDGTYEIKFSSEPFTPNEAVFELHGAVSEDAPLHRPHGCKQGRRHRKYVPGMVAHEKERR